MFEEIYRDTKLLKDKRFVLEQMYQRRVSFRIEGVSMSVAAALTESDETAILSTIIRWMLQASALQACKAD